MYLCYGGTGSGKSITSVALVSLALRHKHPAYHMYCYEARGPKTPPPNEFLDALALTITDAGKVKSDAAKVAAEAAIAASQTAGAAEAPKALDTALLTIGKSLSDDEKIGLLTGSMATLLAETEEGQNAAREFLKAVNNAERVEKGTPALLVIDSLSIPMRTYGASVDTRMKGTPGGDNKTTKWVEEKSRRGEPTMPGGLQPSDISFCEQMEAIALASNTVIIGIVNFDLVPFVDKLEAVVEGFVSIEAPGILSYRQRKNRLVMSYTVPPADLNAASAYLHYGTRKFDITSSLGIMLD